MRFVLASSSPNRLRVLRQAGVEPIVRFPRVDEQAIAATLTHAKPDEVVNALALAKAEDVARDEQDAIVIGCDTLVLSPTNELQGKPANIDAAKQVWKAMAGASVTALTGHAVLRIANGTIVGRAIECDTTKVYFAEPTDDELAAYLASGEPLTKAGAFGSEDLAGWFINRIEGESTNLVGIGLPVIRRLVAKFGVSVADLWARQPVLKSGDQRV